MFLIKTRNWSITRASYMTFKAILSRSTTDNVKSKVMSPKLTQITLDAYITPTEFAQLMEKFFERSFEIEIKDEMPEIKFEKDINV